jgi:hypothetical protein
VTTIELGHQQMHLWSNMINKSLNKGIKKI